MLCPQCRRQVGKDGYCPSGHLARPELHEELKRRAAPPPAPPPPPTGAPTMPVASPTGAVQSWAPAQPQPRAVEVDPYTPAGLGPSNPPPATTIAPPVPGLSVPGLSVPGLDPPPATPGTPFPSPVQNPFASPRSKGRTAAVIVVALVVATALIAFFVLGSTAGASDLKMKFTPGETHTYQLEMTMTGRGGNLNGGFRTDVSIGADMTQTTGAVGKDGNATITYTLKNLHFSENGRRTAAPAGAGAAFSVRMRPDGTVIGLDGGDPFGLEDINPAGQFVNPSNAGPLLPDKKIVPGQSWRIEASQELPDIGTVHATADNTLVSRQKIDGNDAAVIRSIVHVPMNFHFGHDELVKQAKNSGEDGSGIPGNASISMVGIMGLNFQQTIFTSNGLLQSVIGDGTMRGTMTIGGISGLKDGLSIAFDLGFSITMRKISTGQSA